jgi:hypothetical protein
MTTNKLLSLVPMLFITAAACTGLWRFRKLESAVKIMSVAWMLVFLTEATGHTLGFFNIKNHWLYNIFYLLWFLTLALAFRMSLFNKNLKRIIIGFFIFLPLFFILNIFYLQGNKNLQTLFFVAGSCFIIFLALAYFHQLYSSDENERLQNYPFFWFSTGLLLYFGINVLYLGMYNVLIVKFLGLSRIYHHYISIIILILLNLSVLKGFLCRKPSPK